jgi:membrane-associated phospholipid phosphatase
MDYFRGYMSHTRYVLASPARWRPSDWLKVTLLLGATTILADEEEDIQDWVQKNRNSRSAEVARFAKPLGDGRYWVPALATLYCVGYLSGDYRARRTALLGVESLVVTGIFTETIKHICQKHRPRSGDLENIVWDGPRGSGTNLSFPSGHAAVAFAVATVVASEYGDHAVVPPLMYGAATLCALSRVHDNAHWMSDVVIGSAVGHFTAKAIIGLHGGGSDWDFTLEPVIRDGLSGLSLTYRF